MADNYLYAARQDPFQSFIQGFGAGQNIMGNITAQQQAQIKNQMLQNELTKQEAVKNALADYGKGGDPAKAAELIMPHDPELGIKLATLQRTLNKENISSLAAGYDILAKSAPGMLGNPKVYMQTHNLLNSIGLGGIMQPIDTFVDHDTKTFNVPEYHKYVQNLIDAKGIVQAQTQAALNPKYHYLPTQDEQGNAILNRVEERTGKVDQVQVKGYKSGITQEVELPDGTKVRMSTGGKPQGTGVTGVTPAFQTEAEKKLEKQGGVLSQIARIRNTMNPDFLKYEGTIKGGWLALKDKTVGLNPTEQKFLTDFTNFRATAGKMVADTLHDMSGTAVTKQEMERQFTYLVNPGTGYFDADSPTQAKAKLDQLQDFSEKAVARLNYLRKNGFSVRNSKDLEEAINKSGISIDGMGDIMVKRGRELKASGMKDIDVKRTLANEFGLVF